MAAAREAFTKPEVDAVIKDAAEAAALEPNGKNI
jgi:hypothetical protein